MVITYRDDTLDRGGGTDYLTRGRGLYLKDYEFLEFHEWWTERETVQPKGLEGSECLTRRRGLYLKDYEFLECHEWWTERETVQAKGWRGLII